MDEKIRAIFASVFSYSRNHFSDSLSPEDVPGWDSLGHLRLVNEMQEQWKVEFEVDEVMAMENVGAIKKILAARNLT